MVRPVLIADAVVEAEQEKAQKGQPGVLKAPRIPTVLRSSHIGTTTFSGTRQESVHSGICIVEKAKI